MPQFRTYPLAGYKISLGPNDRLRRVLRFMNFPPYLYGSYISFDLIVSPEKKDQKEDINYDWVLWRWDGQIKHQVEKGMGCISVPISKRTRHKLDIAYLSLTGHYILDIELAKNREQFPTDYQIVANFTLEDRDVFMAQWTALLIGIVIGGLLGALLSFLLERF